MNYPFSDSFFDTFTAILPYFMILGIMFDVLLISVLYIISWKSTSKITKAKINLYVKRYLCITGIIIGVLVIFSSGALVWHQPIHHHFEGTIPTHVDPYRSTPIPEDISFGGEYYTYSYQAIAYGANHGDVLIELLHQQDIEQIVANQLLIISLGTIIIAISSICLFKCKKPSLKVGNEEIVVTDTENNAIPKLKSYKQLFDDGVITEEEFELKKKQILDL